MINPLTTSKPNPAPYESLTYAERFIDTCPDTDNTAARISAIRQECSIRGSHRLIGEKASGLASQPSQTDYSTIGLTESQYMAATRYSNVREVESIPTVYNESYSSDLDHGDPTAGEFASPLQALEYLGLAKPVSTAPIQGFSAVQKPCKYQNLGSWFKTLCCSNR